jgi:hypothetical protein
MLELYVNQKPSSEEWRKRIYSGTIYLWTKLKSTQDLGEVAEECIKKFLGEKDYLTGYRDWPVEVFIEKTEALKNYYTNCQEVKDIIRGFVKEIGENPNNYFFDVPRLRVVPHSNYLRSGVSYNYGPHRDTWYGGPGCQINTWMPIFSVESDQTMPIYPSYFSLPIKNSSDQFDVKYWNEVGRPAAVNQVGNDNRTHPLTKEEIDPKTKFLLAGGRGDITVFSGAHLHSSQDNLKNEIRFSTDFRLYFEPDMKNNLGSALIDDSSLNKDYVLKDLFKVSDFSKLVLKGK